MLDTHDDTVKQTAASYIPTPSKLPKGQFPHTCILHYTQASAPKLLLNLRTCTCCKCFIWSVVF